MKECVLKKLIYLYLVIPVLIFIIGWIKPLLAIPVAIGVIVAAGNIWKRIEDTETKIPWKTVLIAFVIALVWCVLAGQGGYYYQSVDHNARNAIFRDLITREWPVIYPEKNMGMIPQSEISGCQMIQTGQQGAEHRSNAQKNSAVFPFLNLRRKLPKDLSPEKTGNQP